MDNIKDVLQSVMGQLAVSEGSDRRNIEDIFCRALNPQEQEHVRFSGMKNGKLFIHVDSSAWLFQMRTKQQRLLKEIQQQVPEVTQIY